MNSRTRRFRRICSRKSGIHGPAPGARLGPCPQFGQVAVHLVVPHLDLPGLRQLEEEPFLDELIQEPAPGLGVLDGRQVLSEARPEVGLEIGAGDLLVVDPDGRGRSVAGAGRGGAAHAGGDQDRRENRDRKKTRREPLHVERIPRIRWFQTPASALGRRLLRQTLAHQRRAFNSERTPSTRASSAGPTGSRTTPSGVRTAPRDFETTSMRRCGATEESGEKRTEIFSPA